MCNANKDFSLINETISSFLSTPYKLQMKVRAVQFILLWSNFVVSNKCTHRVLQGKGRPSYCNELNCYAVSL